MFNIPGSLSGIFEHRVLSASHSGGIRSLFWLTGGLFRSPQPVHIRGEAFFQHVFSCFVYLFILVFLRSGFSV